MQAQGQSRVSYLGKNPAQQIDSILSNERGQDKHVIKQGVSTSIYLSKMLRRVNCKILSGTLDVTATKVRTDRVRLLWAFQPLR